MSSFLYKSFREKKLVLIIALLFNVYNSYARIAKGIGQQKPVKITGLLAVSLISFVAAVNFKRREMRISLFICHTVRIRAPPLV